MVRVLFANHAQFEAQYTNLGDWAIFEEMVDKFKPLIDAGRIEILVPSSDPKFTNAHYPVKAFKRGGIKGWFNTFSAIIKSDIVVIGGGEIVQDRSSMVYIPYQLIRPFVARFFGKRLFGYAIGVGEREEISLLGKLQAHFVLNRFDIITVRDEKSLDVLQNYLKVKRPRVYLTADPALNLIATPVNDLPSEPFITVSVRSVYHREHNILPFSIRKKLGLVPQIYYQEVDGFKNDVSSIVAELMNKYGYKVMFLNTYTGKQMSAKDDAFTKDVIGRLPKELQKDVYVIPQEYTPKQIKAVLGASEMIVTVPLHPLILGASENVPVFSMAYASKNKCFMKQIQHPEHIYSVETIGEKLDVEKILNDIDAIVNNYDDYKDNLLKRVSFLKKREKRNSELLLRLIQYTEKRKNKEKC